MTDAEKIQKIVEFMGGWPEHIEVEAPYCNRCGVHADNWSTGCHGFNPFTRIEDAFVVVERLNYRMSLHRFIPERWVCELWSDDESDVTLDGYADTPAHAITEAAWQVIEKLSQRKSDLPSE